ncbi:MAG: FMN-dependent NADH-azoreductase [Rhodobacteraceae bacterium]|nr:FMN-dependent NADH-azoreductase [Paracoccaceae bacterium]
MTTILRLESAITGAASVSRQLTEQILDHLLIAHPGADVRLRDLAEGLPPIDGEWLRAVETPMALRDEQARAVAAHSDLLLAELRAADILLIALPIYNFAAPATLKAWFDQVARRGETFVDAEGGKTRGLLMGKRAIVAFASGATRLGAADDFASGWVRHMLQFMGIMDVEFVAADAQALNPDFARAKSCSQIAALAA